MTAAIDSFTSPTLKHLREHWWDDAFTAFLAETLRPRPGNRMLDVGCGEGMAEVSIGRLQISQIRLYGIDRAWRKVVQAKARTAAHNQRAAFAAADARRLPFRDDVFDAIYCVAVLQHVAEVEQAVGELARVTRKGGRVVVVEPDNGARYGYSSVASGRQAFDASAACFNGRFESLGETTDAAIGPRLPSLFPRHGIDVVAVRLFPVFHAWIGEPDAALWEGRRKTAERLVQNAPHDTARALASDYLAALTAYEADARAAGESFVEIQNTTLFATVGQKTT